MNRKFTLIVLVLLLCCCLSQDRPSLSEPGVLFPDTQWTYQDLPPMTNEERLQCALETQKDRDAYYRKATEEAQTLSQSLEDYIYRWLDGEVDAELPEAILPPYVNSRKTHDWTLISPDQITPKDQWYALEMYDPAQELHQSSPDPHATYLKLLFIAPFGSKLLIEGDFPHCRFMDYQILEPLDPYHPVTGNMGVCEVPLVDVDIEPDPGDTNPFRMGADRTCEKRHYHITFELEIGNAVDLNPDVMEPPDYRAPGNTRVGSPFGFAGPWGNNVLVPSVVWLRIYAPDQGKEPFGGVDWPKATLQLPTGEKYWITCDKSKAVEDQTALVPDRPVSPSDPYPFEGPSLGWFKMYGIDLSMLEAQGYMNSSPWGKSDIETTRKEIRSLYGVLWNRGAYADPPGNFECGATCCNYVSYLLRPIALDEDKVIVLTGQLPEFPQTRQGQPTMTGGEVRYFSITHQQGSGGLGKSIYTSVPHGSLMDDEIFTNEGNEYIIIFSRAKEKPKNALRENGITWQEWGPASHQVMVLRWMSVMPEWHLPGVAPDSTTIPWVSGAWSQDTYDKTLVGENRQGTMGPYHPVIHYMTREEFEALGTHIVPEDVPDWTSSRGHGILLMQLAGLFIGCLFFMERRYEART